MVTMIELHRFEDGGAKLASIWVNASAIISLEECDVGNEYKYTQVDCLDDACYCVVETPKEIMNLMGCAVISSGRHFVTITDDRDTKKEKKRKNRKSKFAKKRRSARW